MRDLHNTWPHRWLNPKAGPGISEIAGRGVFAQGPILVGETVAVLGGLVVPLEDIADYRRRMTQVGIQVDDGFFIVPAGQDELDIFGVFNHSCDPNLGFATSISLIALRDIPAGVELTFDYAFSESYLASFACHCGSEACRGRVTASDWLNEKIQLRHSEHFSPYLRRRIGTKGDYGGARCDHE